MDTSRMAAADECTLLLYLLYFMLQKSLDVSAFPRLSSQFYRPGRTWWDRAVHVSQMQKETEVHQKILDSETTKGLYKHEK